MVEIIQNGELADYWPIKSFREAYKDIGGEKISHCLGLALGSEKVNPDKTAVILVRIFIENGQRAKENQKYIMGLRFYSFGDLATMDIISLDLPNHRDIVREHARRMHWYSSLMGSEETYEMPIFITGAHLQITADEDGLNFSSSSGDFGNNLLGLDLNKIMQQIAFLCGLSEEGNKTGANFLEELLGFILKNKRQPDFYEKFVEQYVASGMTGQNFASLLMMKTIDRKLSEEGSFLELLVEEATNGFVSKCLLIVIAHKIKK